MALALAAIYRKVVERLSAQALVKGALRDADLEGPVRIVALGKAACGMARGAAELLGEVRGLAASFAPGAAPDGVRVLCGAHPVPDAASERAGRALLEEASGHPVDATALYLVSGGGSAIAAVPAPGLSLADKIACTRELLRAGTSIDETNAVRKHLSALKGGQLAAASRARRRLALVLCDVPSGELSSVASGPTCGDPTTFGDCRQIVARRQVLLPPAVAARLREGERGLFPETPKPGDPRVAGVENRLLASPLDLAVVAREEAGEPCEIEARPFTESVEELAGRIARRVQQGAGPRLLAFAGEPTVRVPAKAGSGGRMQHLALLLAREFGATGFEALCAGSDGRDGDTPHAGALVDAATLGRARSLGFNLDAALARFDSAAACAALGCALPAFDSGTNLCDLVLVRRA